MGGGGRGEPTLGKPSPKPRKVSIITDHLQKFFRNSNILFMFVISLLLLLFLARFIFLLPFIIYGSLYLFKYLFYLFFCCFFLCFFFGVLFLFANFNFNAFLFFSSQGVLFSYLILKINFSHGITLSQSMLKQQRLASYLLWCFTAVPLRHLQTPDT